MSIATDILQLKQDMDDVCKAGRLGPIASSECLNGNLSGAAVSVNDVLPIEHNVSAKLGSKNLIDGSTILDGCEISGNTLISNPDWYVVSVDVLPNTQYTVSGFSSLTRVEEDINGIKTRANDRLDVFITLPTTVKVYFNSTKTVYDNNQLELGSTATPYTPYATDFSGVEVSRYGKNLLSSEIGDFANWTKLGDQYTKAYYLDLPVGTYTFSCDLSEIEDNNYGYFYLRKSNDDWVTNQSVYIVQVIPNTLPCTFTVDTGYKYSFWWWSGVSSRFDHYSNFQLELGTTATPYEPYIEPTTHQSTADGTVEGVTSISPNMTLLSDNNGVVINAHYYKDPDIVMSNLQQAVALSGGE